MQFAGLCTLSKPVSPYIREIIVENTVPCDEQFSEQTYLVREWSKQPNSHFMKLSNGTLVFIRGRIEKDDEVGVLFVIEHYETLRRFKIDETCENSSNT